MGKKKMKSQARSNKDLIINKAFDLLIVIAGVSIAFQLNSLKENNDHKKLQRFYLESMVNDLNQDLAQYEDNYNELITDLQTVYSCVARMEKKEDVRDSIGLVVFNILSYKTFEGNRNTYATILSSNGLSLIQDPFIRNSMLEYYRLYASIERFERDYASHVGKIHDYFSLHMDYNHSQRFIAKEIFQNVQTKNLLTISAGHLQSGAWRYEESIEKAESLRDSINTFLSK